MKQDAGRLTILLLFLLVWTFCCSDNSTNPDSPVNNWLPPTEHVNGELGEIEGIPLLTLWGTHYEQGYAHGYLFAPEIMEYLEKELNQEPGLVEFVESVVLPTIEQYSVPPEYLQEMEGFLAGMGARAGAAVYVAAFERTLTLNDVIASTCIDNAASRCRQITPGGLCFPHAHERIQLAMRAPSSEASPTASASMRPQATTAATPPNDAHRRGTEQMHRRCA